MKVTGYCHRKIPTWWRINVSVLCNCYLIFSPVVEIGFIQRIYDVSERAVGPLGITVQLVSGQLGREVIVTVNTKNGSAIGSLLCELAYKNIISLLLTK